MPLLLILGVLASGAALYASQRKREEFDLFDEPLAPTPAAQPTPALSPVSKRYINPLGNTPFRLSSRFGPRTNPKTGQAQIHTGIDLAAPAGTPIYAAAPGQVVAVFRDEINGNGVKLRHTDGTGSAYIHMNEAPLVGVGEVVSLGQQIGRVGSTGRSTNPHLHFTVYDVQGNKIDPEPMTSLLPWSAARGTTHASLS